jgi:hypothetical protein
MPRFYTDQQRTLQKQFSTRKMADLLHDVIVHQELQDAERGFIESRDMFFLATVDGSGPPSCSYKGGDPGFVEVVDRTTLAFASYDGNGMFRVQGTASLLDRDPLLAGGGLAIRPAPRLRDPVRGMEAHRRGAGRAATQGRRDAGKTAAPGGTITVEQHEAKRAAGRA